MVQFYRTSSLLEFKDIFAVTMIFRNFSRLNAHKFFFFIYYWAGLIQSDCEFIGASVKLSERL